MASQQSSQSTAEASIVSHIGMLEIDWPRTIGFYGGLAIAVGMEMVAPPLAIFIAAYPLLKMLNRPNAPKAVQIVAQVLEGVAKPINGDSEDTIRINSKSLPGPKAVASSVRKRVSAART